MAPMLPKKKREILEYLKETITSQGYAPTLSEIAKHFNLSSLATVHEHLDFLEKKGFIRRSKSYARSLSIVNQSDTEDIQQAEFLLPLVGVIAAGSPIEAIEDEIKKVNIPEEIAQTNPNYVLRVKGDSMIENFIMDGDFVVIKKTEIAQNGDTVVALLDDGTATLKEFYKEKDHIRLQPANKNYEPIRIPSVNIQGKVVGIIRSYA